MPVSPLPAYLERLSGHRREGRPLAGPRLRRLHGGPRRPPFPPSPLGQDAGEAALSRRLSLHGGAAVKAGRQLGREPTCPPSSLNGLNGRRLEAAAAPSASCRAWIAVGRRRGGMAAGLDRPQVVSHAQQALNYTLFDCKWVPRSARLLCLGSTARGSGLLQLYELRGGRLALLREIEKAKPLKCGTFGATSLQQRYFATGDFGGNLNIWNLEAPEIPVYSVKGHKEIINSIDGVGGLGIGEGAPEIVTGSRDGTVKVWDPRQKDTPVANMEPVQGESKRDCWTVAFGNAYNQEERVVCAGYDNGDIKLFDLKTMSLQWETNIKNGVCSVEFDRKDVNMNKLVATSLEGKFHVFDMRTQHPTKGFASVSEKAQKSTIWQVRHLPQNRDIFMTSGGAGSLHLWKYEYPSRRSKKDSEGAEMGVAGSLSLLQNVTLSTQPISSLDWSPDKKGLCVCGAFDQTVRVLIVTKLNKV
ncbi:dynein axonemal assembly factor 10 [Chroicocephalus ridibundus]|uniref:dynein axonemal assembly factor 10 n=1 Tax=Chroicocephalus ridibundus TaxID=1192867 RepID=UPI002FDC84E9